MSNPIEQATLALYAADDAVQAAERVAQQHLCVKLRERCNGVVGMTPEPCPSCQMVLRDAHWRVEMAENALLRAARDARPRCP